MNLTQKDRGRNMTNLQTIPPQLRDPELPVFVQLDSLEAECMSCGVDWRRDARTPSWDPPCKCSDYPNYLVSDTDDLIGADV